ncbi:hypothetical protein EMCRGX_G032079 [Ephydatia muelleri]
MNELHEFKLPEPDTRLVVLGKTVFKIKYKTSYTVLPKDEAPFKTGWFYDELKKITKAVLTHVTQGCPSVPLRSEHLAVYPGFHQWESVGDLQFSQNGEELQAHPNVILLLVKLLVPVKEDTSALPTKQTQEHLTGKRKLPPDDECLPPDSTPSSYHLTRKKIRLEGNSQMVPVGGCGAAFPTGTCTHVPIAASSFTRAASPSTETVAHCASETMRSLHNLSQPTQLKDNEIQTWLNPWKIIKYVLHPLFGALQSKS